MDTIDSFGYWVRRRRKALDLTQDALAKRVGCSVMTIRKIEGDLRRPSRQMAELLADCLNVGAHERERFISAARAELRVERLPGPVEPLEPHRAGAAPGVDAPPRRIEGGSLPTGTVTFLFADLPASARLWERDPRGAAVALQRYHTLLRQIVSAHQGTVFKTAGELICAAFAQAPAAVEAALAVQQALLAEPALRAEQLHPRIALHTGTPALRDGEYTGLPLSRAGRLLQVGHAGQSLVSGATYELVRDYAPLGAVLQNLGAHRLRDLTRPERIYQLVAPGLPADFPALRTLEALQTNLPAQLTPLVQRQQEVAQACALMRRPGVRLLTLTGSGGVGKTRIGLQVAAEMIDTKRDGVYLVELAPVTDPEMVVPAIANALGVREEPGQPLRETLMRSLRARQLLLVLDNFEQVIHAAPLIAALLMAALEVQVLVTSREALRVSGEHELRVAPLALPDLQRLPPLDTLAQYAAVELFIQRAQAAQPSFAITSENGLAVAKICDRLDGLPLAIELAAVRVRLLSPQALLARLDRRLSLLTDGPRDLPARQRTLRGAIDWSYHLLNPAEQALFRRLSVYVGGWTLDVAASAEPELASLDHLTSLVDKSLVSLSEARGGPRFVMLETLREYAQEQLSHVGEEATAREAHAGAFLGLAEAAARDIVGAQQQVRLAQLDDEHDNLRAALRWLIEQGHTERALQLGAYLWWYWWLRGHVSEGRAWIGRVLGLPLPEQATEAQRRARATLLYRAGFLAIFQGEVSHGEALGAESLALFHTLGDGRGIAWASYVLAQAHSARGSGARAAELHTECLRLARQFNERLLIAWVLNDIGVLSIQQGDYLRAEGYYQESLELFEQVGSGRDIACALNNLGSVAEAQGNEKQAVELYTQSLARFRELGDRIWISVALLNLGIISRRQGDVGGARTMLLEAVPVLFELGWIHLVARGLAGLAAVASDNDQPLQGAVYYGAAEALSPGWKDTLDPSERVQFERELTTVRDQTDPVHFLAAWEDGYRLPIEQLLGKISSL